MENTSPEIVPKSRRCRNVKSKMESLFQQEADEEELDVLEIFEWLKDLKDPEYPLTLEELKVVSEKMITVDNKERIIRVYFTPTVPHCSQATLIGLMIKSMLYWVLPPGYRSVVLVSEGTHSSEASINKQLADKERVAAALENVNVLSLILRGATRPRNVDSLIESNIID